MNIIVKTIHPIRHEILVTKDGVTFGTTIQAARPPSEDEARQIFLEHGKDFWIDASSEEDFII